MITFTPLHQVPVGIDGARLGGVSYLVADDPTRTQYFDLDLVVFAAVKLWGEQAEEPTRPPTVQTVLTFVTRKGHGRINTVYVPVSAISVEPWVTENGTYEPGKRQHVTREILKRLPHYHSCPAPVVSE